MGFRGRRVEPLKRSMVGEFSNIVLVSQSPASIAACSPNYLIASPSALYIAGVGLKSSCNCFLSEFLPTKAVVAILSLRAG